VRCIREDCCQSTTHCVVVRVTAGNIRTRSPAVAVCYINSSRHIPLTISLRSSLLSVSCSAPCHPSLLHPDSVLFVFNAVVLVPRFTEAVNFPAIFLVQNSDLIIPQLTLSSQEIITSPYSTLIFSVHQP